MSGKVNLGPVGYIACTAAVLVGIPLRAYTLAMLWLWFVVPLGAKAISPAHAFGLSAMITFITFNPQGSSGSDSGDKPLILAAIASILMPIFALVAGAVAHAFM